MTTVPTSIGSYRILSKLGEGGIGAVYLAEHTIIGRKAAIKTLLPKYSQDRQMANRFFNEARAATAIRHPGIIEVYDFGFHDDGTAFIVMEFLDGEPLKARLRRRGNLEQTKAIELVAQIAGALAAAHEQGIVHRDLKPDNIFLVPDPEIGERIKLLDFGIAKLMDDRWTPEMKTGTDVVMGTPAYMSPEQCCGAKSVDHRTDLYALGCIFFELLCGKSPFLRQGHGATIGAHIYEQPPLPRSMNPAISPSIEGIILHLLAKDPNERVASAVSLVQMLSAASLDTGQPAPQAPALLSMRLVSLDSSPSSHLATSQTTLSTANTAVQTPSVTASRRLPWLAFAVAFVLCGMGALVLVQYSRTPSRAASPLHVEDLSAAAVLATTASDAAVSDPVENLDNKGSSVELTSGDTPETSAATSGKPKPIKPKPTKPSNGTTFTNPYE